MTSLYQKIDNEIMAGVNRAVRTYNWTTGRTKTDLANKCLDAATICLGFQMVCHEPIVIPFNLFSIFNIHKLQKGYKEADKREIAASKAGCQDFEVEELKKGPAKLSGYLTIGAAGAVAGTSVTFLNNREIAAKIGDYSLAMGLTLIGASQHIMRADYLPPRKSCVERGLDKLVELGKSLRRKPAVELNSGMISPDYLSYLEARR